MKVEYKEEIPEWRILTVGDVIRLNGTIVPGYEEQIKGKEPWEEIERRLMSTTKKIRFWDKPHKAGSVVEYEGDTYIVKEMEAKSSGIAYHYAVSMQNISVNAEDRRERSELS